MKFLEFIKSEGVIDEEAIADFKEHIALEDDISTEMVDELDYDWIYWIQYRDRFLDI